MVQGVIFLLSPLVPVLLQSCVGEVDVRGQGRSVILAQGWKGFGPGREWLVPLTLGVLLAMWRAHQCESGLHFYRLCSNFFFFSLNSRRWEDCEAALNCHPGPGLVWYPTVKGYSVTSPLWRAVEDWEKIMINGHILSDFFQSSKSHWVVPSHALGPWKGCICVCVCVFCTAWCESRVCHGHCGSFEPPPLSLMMSSADRASPQAVLSSSTLQHNSKLSNNPHHTHTHTHTHTHWHTHTFLLQKVYVRYTLCIPEHHHI